jgi:hypothetical protein
VLGTVPWILISAALAVAALVLASGRYGWLFATLLQLAAMPRVYAVNLALLLAAPLPQREGKVDARPDAAARPVPVTRTG